MCVDRGLILAVLALVTGCTTTHSGFYRVIHDFEPSPATRTATGTTGDLAIANGATIVFAVYGCEDDDDAPSSVDPRAPLDCPALLGELEAAALAAGYRVVPWRDAAVTNYDARIEIQRVELQARAKDALTLVATTYRRDHRVRSPDDIVLTDDDLARDTRDRCRNASLAHLDNPVSVVKVDVVVRERPGSPERGHFWRAEIQGVVGGVLRLEQSEPAVAEGSTALLFLPAFTLIGGIVGVSGGFGNDDTLSIGLGLGALALAIPMSLLATYRPSTWEDADELFCRESEPAWERARSPTNEGALEWARGLAREVLEKLKEGQ